MPRLRERARFMQPSFTVGKIEYFDLAMNRFFYSPQNRNIFSGQDVAEVEKTIDELHYGPPYTSGGPFENYKSEYPYDQIQGNAVYNKKVGLTTYRYTGGFVPSGFGTAAFPYSDLKNVGTSGPYGPGYGDPSSYGAQAWNRFRPKTSGFDGATFLGELKDLPGMLKSAAKQANDIYKTLGGKRSSNPLMPKELAKHYLEHNFGWSPFINDLKKLYKTYQDQDRIYRRLQRQNGNWLKKGGIVLETGTVTDKQDTFAEDAPYVWPALPTALLAFPYSGRPNKWGNTLFETQTEQKIWFEGSFRYYLPGLNTSGSQNWNYIHSIVQIYGLRVSPSTIWNLTPWSWLADWFGNVGDVVDNITATIYDRLLARYAYLMSTSRRKRFNASVVHTCNGAVNCLWHQRIEAKHRVSASPFGFSLQAGQLSAYQWSILAALGMSRG